MRLVYYIILLPALLRFVPVSMINLPHRQFWLSPQKRQETFDKITGCMAGFGILTLSMLLAVIQLTIQANMDGTHRLPTPVVSHGALRVHRGSGRVAGRVLLRVPGAGVRVMRG